MQRPSTNPTIITPRRRPGTPPPPPRFNEVQILGWLFAALVLVIIYSLVTLPDIKNASALVGAGTVSVYDRFDQFVCSLEDGQTRESVPLAKVPMHTKQAVIAIEDKDFYRHEGISIPGIARAFVVNLKAGKVMEGGSTISQQLAKNLFLDSKDRSLLRKIREAALALQIERNYTKENILEIYLNRVYFGRGAWGIQNAASAYFGKDVTQLNMAESAFLAGMLQAPSSLGKPANLKKALARQHLVLSKMAENGFITNAQADQATKTKMRFRRSQFRPQQHPYYMAAVLEQLKADIGEDQLEEGVKVYTNMDPVAQEQAERALSRGIYAAPPGINQGALASVSVEDGGVVALVGGVGDYFANQFNRATSPHTLGSSFKPFVYLTAFNKRTLAPDSTIVDEPIVFPSYDGGPDYAPKNYDGTFMGPMTVREALGMSRNTCAVRVGASVGIADVIATARAAGLNAKLDNNLSLALGSSAASPLDMAGAFATFARGGEAIEPWLIRKVENNERQVIRTYAPMRWNAFHPFPTAQLVDCLQFAVERGTGVNARLGDRAVAGKTGTSDRARDLWFVGFTPDLVTAVWGGNDDYKAVPGSVTGGAVMARIWKSYASNYYQRRPTPARSFSTGTDPWSQWWRSMTPTQPEEPKPEETQQNAEGQQGEQSVDIEVDPNKMDIEPVQPNGMQIQMEGEQSPNGEGNQGIGARASSPHSEGANPSVDGQQTPQETPQPAPNNFTPPGLMRQPGAMPPGLMRQQPGGMPPGMLPEPARGINPNRPPARRLEPPVTRYERQTPTEPPVAPDYQSAPSPGPEINTTPGE